jgi:hypothetical protein
MLPICMTLSFGAARLRSIYENNSLSCKLRGAGLWIHFREKGAYFIRNSGRLKIIFATVVVRRQNNPATKNVPVPQTRYCGTCSKNDHHEKLSLRARSRRRRESR